MANQPDEYDFDPSEHVYAGGDPNPSALPDDDEFEEDFGNELEPSEAPDEAEGAKNDAEEPENTDESVENDAEEPESEGDEDEGADEEPKDDIRIPKYRLDEESAKRKAAEQRARELEERIQALERANEAPQDTGPTVEDQIAELENQYLQQALDGDIEDAAATRSKIRGLEREMFKQESSTVTETTLTRREAEAAINSAVATAQADYPALDEASDSYDAEAVTDTLALFESYIQKGVHPGEAMERATTRTARMYGWAKPGEAEAEASEAPKPKPKPSKKDVERAAAAASQQPPKMQTGRQADEGDSLPDIMDLTDEEFDALPEGTKKRLRGDVI